MGTTWQPTAAAAPLAPPAAAGTPDLGQGLTTVRWDTHVEAAWVGTELGYVASITPHDCLRYTQFRAHSSDVRQIVTTPDGVVSLGAESIAFNSRTGLVLGRLESEIPKDWQALLPGTSGTTFYVGGNDAVVSVYDATRNTIVNEYNVDTPVAIMRRSRLLCCASPSGEVVLRDPYSLKAEHRLGAHMGAISDIDVSGNLLVTCGFSQRSGNYVIDQLVMVYDLRMMRSLPPISFPPGPYMLRFHPTFASTLVVAAQHGVFQFAEVGMTSTMPQSFHTDNAAGPLTCMDISPSGHVRPLRGTMMLFGDATGFVYEWSNDENAQATMEGILLEPLPLPPVIPAVTITDNTPLNLVGMPYYTEPLLSIWPNDLTFQPGEPTPPIDPAILEQVKVIDFVGYAPNPPGRLRNQVVKPRKREAVEPDRPKFRSEQEREQARREAAAASAAARGGSDRGQADKGANTAASPGVAVSPTGETPMAKRNKVPRHYQRVEIQYSRLGVEDFDFEYYNRTVFSGLETHIPNSYANPLLQLLYFLPPVRAAVLAHLPTHHDKDSCLACELYFLFRMLDGSKGANCHANNFLDAFGRVPQVAGLGLNEPEDPTPQTPYALMMQKLTRFLFEYLHTELQAIKPPVPATKESAPADLPRSLADLFGMRISGVDRCLHCGHETSRETSSMLIDLTVVRKVDIDSIGTSRATTEIAQLLTQALYRENQTKAWCDKCRKYQPTVQIKPLHALPPAFAINCALPSAASAAATPASAAAGAGADDDGKKAAAAGLGASAAIPTSLAISRDGQRWVVKAQHDRGRGVSSLTERFAAMSTSPPAPAASDRPATVAAAAAPVSRAASEGEPLAEPLESVWADSEQLAEKSDAAPETRDVGGDTAEAATTTTASTGAADGKTAEAADADVVYYDLVSFIVQIQGEREIPHLVAHVWIPDQYHRRNGAPDPTATGWYLFNDFLVTPIALSKAVQAAPWKLPTFLCYVQRDLLKQMTAYDVEAVPLDPRYLLDGGKPGSRQAHEPGCEPLTAEELPQVVRRGGVCAIDAEFVARKEEESEIRPDGTRSLLRPSRLALARVSVVRGEGPKQGVPFIDDYITMTSPVADYLTKFSGIKPGDLDPASSPHVLTTLKAAYIRLRALVDQGCIFVGHGLKQDFRIINIRVPPEQVIDTVEIFRLPRQRKVSLRFLAWYLLQRDIQSETHSSVEDSQAALAIYNVYQKLREENSFEQALQDLYECGRAFNWMPSMNNLAATYKGNQAVVTVPTGPATPAPAP